MAYRYAETDQHVLHLCEYVYEQFTIRINPLLSSLIKEALCVLYTSQPHFFVDFIV